MNGVLYKVRESFSTVKPAEKVVADYILHHPENVVSMSIQQVAAESFSSPSAVLRFCKTLGFGGFKDFKLKLAGDLSILNMHDMDKHELKPGDSLTNIMTVVTNNNIQSLTESLQLLDIEQLTKAFHYLVNAKKIDLYGVGSSYLIASDAVQKFMRINKPCTAYSDFHMQRVSAVNLEAEDVAVAISYSGATKQVIECIQIAKSQGAKVIAVTKYADTELSSLADAVLFVAANEDDFRSAAMSSRMATLNVIDILYTACAHEEYDDALFHLKRTHEIIQQSGEKGGTTQS
ncbi:MurR/RpiR family transcriptional regulator [Halobacillus salinarum]|uniref:MurR/RpiR family transcriptional regulator n=1 Tax=Halobacillus salinarum TaxID=2932257 RepID=A0ABY4EIP3_9BACI|nr:MurR/RpiR family transcriptional regulator [Halobacillus salinarum]UOQ44014.1 MurR/RpiR family transcriptional regulator [Halobacillus salinarum]